MVDIEVLKRVIVENQEFVRGVELTEREYGFEEGGRYVLVGLRQAGKSYLMYQRMKAELAAGRRPEELCLVNFDDERLAELKAKELDAILVAYRSLYPGEPSLYFDEIQNVEGWEKFARRLANEGRRVWVTGSNAKMLSREIASTLGGRYLVKEVWPYSFSEYLRAAGVREGPGRKYGRGAGEVARRFEAYLRFGGLPETLRHADKRGWLNGLFGRIFFSDMVARNGVRNEEGLRLTVKKLAESVCQSASYHRIADLVKAAGAGGTASGVRDYVRFMRESCLVFSIANSAGSFSEREGVQKHYFTDNGLLNIFLGDPDSALLENLCAVHLRRRYGEELKFYRRNAEVDFHVPEAGLGVQACWSLANAETARREVAALEKLDAWRPLGRMLVVTRNERGEIPLANGKRVEVLPAAEWLLAAC